MKSIHPLVKAARDKKLPHPGQLDQFDERHWREFSDLMRLKDAEGVAFYSGACWLNSHFHRVKESRKQYCFGGSGSPDFEELVRAHIAGANYAFWQVVDEQNAAYARLDTPAIEQLLVNKTTMVGESDPVGANRVNMHRLDSLRGPLYELFRNKKRMQKLFPGDRPQKLFGIDFFLAEMRMSQHYHNFSALWQELLYGRSLFAYQPGTVFFIQRQVDYHRIKTIAEFRRDHFHVTGLSDARNAMDSHPVTNLWPTYLKFQPGQPITLTYWHHLSDVTQRLAHFQTLAAFFQVDDHLKPLLMRKQGQNADRVLQSILDVWIHLAVLACQIDESLHTDRDITDWAELVELAPQFDRTDLAEMLSQCTGYGIAEIEAAIDLITWQGKTPQEDLWAQPLVALENTVVFPISAFLTASISRNVDCWMGKIDPNDTRRGKMFENDLLRVLQECRDVNPVMKEHLRFTSSVKPLYDGETEEIDLTFSFGNLLVVAEARSRKTSITPLDYDNELYDSNGLIHKTGQASRKAAFIRKNLDVFCQSYYPHIKESDDIEVIPLVIINGQFHAGYPLNEVPIVDPALLLHFLRDREIRFMADPQSQKHQYGIPLWRTLEEAQERFRKYLLCPGLIRIYNSMCIETENRSANLGKDFEQFVQLSYEMVFTNWEQYLAQIENLFPGQLVKYY
ncbi:hypothetical protein [Lonsdalea quercina]|uniref:hypothetical protein n=1 Tax=Lonsdalea quercina TaxID=71657 RepID=UPI003976174A